MNRGDRKRTFASRVISIGIMLMGTSLIVPAGAQSVAIDAVADDTRRALIVRAVVRSDDTGELVDAFVSNGPPRTHIGNPEHVLVEQFDVDGMLIGSSYEWDPRWRFVESESGGESLELVEAGTGAFQVPLGANLHSVRLTAMTEPLQPVVLLVVGVASAVAAFCQSNALDPNCDEFQWGTMDRDDDSVPDHADLCPDTAFPESPIESGKLGANRWALSGDGRRFTQAAPQKGSQRQFSIVDTAGCNCAQLLQWMRVANVQAESGCPTGIMEAWLRRTDAG